MPLTLKVVPMHKGNCRRNTPLLCRYLVVEMHRQQTYRGSNFNVGWITDTLIYKNSLSPSFTTCSPSSSIMPRFLLLSICTAYFRLLKKNSHEIWKACQCHAPTETGGLSFLHEYLPLFILRLSDSQEFIKESLIVNQMQMQLCPNLQGVIVIQSLKGLWWWITHYMKFLNKDTARKW
jgi:hypothetical protein